MTRPSKSELQQAKDRVVRWAGFCDDKLHFDQFGDATLFRTRADARKVYTDVRKVNITFNAALAARKRRRK